MRNFLTTFPNSSTPEVGRIPWRIPMNECCKQERKSTVTDMLVFVLIWGFVGAKLWQVRPKEFRHPVVTISHETSDGRVVIDKQVYDNGEVVE